MPDHAVASTPPTDLRARAAARLGSAAADHPGSRGGPADALAVLYTLASSPATAADALALLHELQVHQVELDLQAQELRESRAELESALRRQVELHDFQPVGLFAVDRQFVVRELNLAGARLLGLEREAARGLRLDTLFPPRDADRLHTVASMAALGESAPAVPLQWPAVNGQARSTQAHVGLDPAGDGYLVVLASAQGPDGRP